MMQAISRKDVHNAIEGIKTHASSTSLQDTLQGWLLTYFGHHSEIRSDKQIDTLRLPITQQLHTFDPLYMNLLAESFVSSHVFDGLVKRSGERDKIVPCLAHLIESMRAGRSGLFSAQRGVIPSWKSADSQGCSLFYGTVDANL